MSHTYVNKYAENKLTWFGFMCLKYLKYINFDWVFQEIEWFIVTYNFEIMSEQKHAELQWIY